MTTPPTHLSGHVHGEEAAQSVAPGCCHTPGGHGIDRAHCHRCFVETPDRSTPRAEEVVELLISHRTVLSISDQEFRCEPARCGWSAPLIPDVQDQRDVHDRAHVVATLTAAGLLATEQEWGVRWPGGATTVAWSSREAAASAAVGGFDLVSRGVTAWREQA